MLYQNELKMKRSLKVSLVQADLMWEDVDANLHMLEVMLDGLEEDTDLVVLPETFSTGFTMQAHKLAEGDEGLAVSWLKRMAEEKTCHFTGSMIFRDRDQAIYNRLFWVSPEGIEDYYDKRHLFRPGGEME